ncbi:unnamed protein product [Phytophthora fragariaefolia]|uniref:Unnamed protein product n=1 Tax=Phytophthora fragariaefolia TaxID=1490495 RepID=A0A9W6U399_9STRA|nr:unnamed protein product [Phytophthora fragariaefolia]
MRELRAVAHERGLKYYLHLSKPELFSLLQRKEGGGSSRAATALAEEVKDVKESSVRRVETATRASERLSSRKQKRKKRENDKVDASRDAKKAKVVINTLDPIMLTELGLHTVRVCRRAGRKAALLLVLGSTDSLIFGGRCSCVQFEFTRTNGSVVVYNVETLVQYILATGDFSEPETRIPFSDEDLRRIDAEEGEMLLIMSVFPSFSDIFEQIRRSDSEYAKHSMGHFIQYMKGPKNHPTVDHSGLLPVILGFLEDVAMGKQGASAFGF